MTAIQLMAPEGITSVSAGGRPVPIRPDRTVILEDDDPAIGALQSHGFTVCAGALPLLPVAEMTRAQAVMRLTDEFLAEVAAMTTEEIKARLTAMQPEVAEAANPIDTMARGELFALLKEKGIAADATSTNAELRAAARVPVRDAA